MKSKGRNRRSLFMHFIPCIRSPLPAIIWSLFGVILIFHFYSTAHLQSGEKIQAIRLKQVAAAKTLSQVEEETFHMPPPRIRRSPRAIKRRGPRKPPTVIDEFLDDSSDLHSFFFPDQRFAIDPLMDGNDSMHFYPGRQWLDTDGNPIQAHGGGILYVESQGTYYWYGENKDGPTYQAHRKAAARVSIIYASLSLFNF